jgi:integrase/recombinase XerD
MTHTFAAVRASRAKHSKSPLSSTFSEKLQITAAMELLHSGVDITVIALWLGHESPTTTRVYLHADMALKEKALARTTSPDTTPDRYQAPDTLLAFLDQL